MMKFAAFISYSHEDRDCIQSIFQLVQAMTKAMTKKFVFLDNVSLIAGEKWEVELFKALSEAQIVIVCWCDHSAKSKYVELEYTTALREKKIIIPLLLDDTALPYELEAYQAIDFKDNLFHADALSDKYGAKQIRVKDDPDLHKAARKIVRLLDTATSK